MESEYQRTKEETEQLVQNLCIYLGSKKGNDFSYKEMSRYSPVDFIISKNGRFVCYLEVKIRSHTFGTYKQEKIPVSKYCFAYTYKHKIGRKSLLMVAWKDKVGLIDLLKIEDIDAMVARHDRGEGQDLYAMYDKDKFKILPID